MSLRAIVLLVVRACIPAVAGAAPDVLVVCDTEYRDALEPWIRHRLTQGHEVALVAPPQSFEVLQKVVRTAADGGRLRYVVLVGDAPALSAHAARGSAEHVIPTAYTRPTVNVRWGSPAHLATDHPLADVDGDGRPDVAVGRIPVDSAEELLYVIHKTLRFEQYAARGEGAERVNIVAGVGGFGKTIDAVIEAAARKLISDHLPDHCQAQLAHANPNSEAFPGPQQFRADLRAQLTRSSRAWIYLGHGQVNALDAIVTEQGLVPMLAVDDLAATPLTSPRTGHPLAVMLACYTGAFDAPVDCLAEELLVQPGGPVAVLAATRVSMPYGNTVLGYELLRASFAERFATLGEMYVAAQRRVLDEPSDDATRDSFNKLALGLMPAPVDLAAERREHVEMYHLLGDPLLRMQGDEQELRLAEEPGEEIAR